MLFLIKLETLKILFYFLFLFFCGSRLNEMEKLPFVSLMNGFFFLVGQSMGMEILLPTRISLVDGDCR